MTEYRTAKVSLRELEQILVRILGLPRTTTSVTLSLRAGEIPTIQASFFPVPIEVIEDVVTLQHITFRLDNRMERWWVKGGYRLYRRTK